MTKLSQQLKPGDEFFLYITAHGNKKTGKLNIHADDVSEDFENISYRQINRILSQFDPKVEITVMFDACYSGQATNGIQGPNITVITASDATSTTIIGGAFDSFTEDWIEAFTDANKAKADTNNDGKVDWKEAFDWAKDQELYSNPKFGPPSASGK